MGIAPYEWVQENSVGADAHIGPPCHSEPVTDVTGVGIRMLPRKEGRIAALGLRPPRNDRARTFCVYR